MIIAIADDQRNMRDQLVGALLHVAPRENIFEFDDGKPVLEFILKEQPDLAILDIVMNGMSGLEVCHALRAQGDKTPIIIATSMGQKNAAHAVRVQGYIMKPFMTDIILATVMEVIDGVHRPSPVESR